jgi:hypothetical protein
MTVDEFVGEIKNSAPSASAEKVAELEVLVGFPIPTDYRQFLLHCNGGYVGGALWYQGPAPDGRPADAGVHHVGGLRDESCYSLLRNQETYFGRIPHGLMWIMDDPFGNAICLRLVGPHRGGIYFWDHEHEPYSNGWTGDIDTAQNIFLIASSFSAFVAGLKVLDDGA